MLLKQSFVIMDESRFRFVAARRTAKMTTNNLASIVAIGSVMCEAWRSLCVGQDAST
jgi:hypothetical protein